MGIRRIGFALALLAGTGGAQQNVSRSGAQPGSQSADDGFKVRVDANLVLLPTRVEDKRGDTIYGLSADQFLIEDNGARRMVTIEDSPEAASLSLVVAIQCGRSAAPEFGKLKGLATMIDSIVGAAPHEVAVVVYGEKPYLLSDFSERSAATHAALSRLETCGDNHAATLDAVAYSLNLLRRRQNRYRHAILLIGEQRDHGSGAKVEEVAAQLGRTDTVIYSLGFSPVKSQFMHDLRYGPGGGKKEDAPQVYSVHPAAAAKKPAEPEEAVERPDYTDHPPLFSLPPEFLMIANALRDNTAAEIAALSGGEYFDFVSQKKLEEALHRVSNQVHNYYLLSFRLESQGKPESHSIRVSIAGHPEAVIQTRKSYWSGIP